MTLSVDSLFKEEVLHLLRRIHAELSSLNNTLNTPIKPLHQGTPAQPAKNSARFFKGLKYPEVRSLILRLRKEGTGFKEIEEVVKASWPNEPRKHVTRAAAHRFWQSAKAGRLKEFGIDGVL